MNIPFIDLTLSDRNENECSFDSAIKKSRLIILLGAPGSGKSRLLENYHQNNNKTSMLLSVDEFMDFGTPIEAKTLLLDGLDEYRNTVDSKTSVARKLAKKINELSSPEMTIIVACREMDWFGNTDEEALNRYIGINADVYTIQPLNNDQKWKFKNSLGLSDQNFGKLDEYGFLANPQLFIMSSKIDAQKIGRTKSALYKAFVESCCEKNPTNVTNKVNQVGCDSFFKTSTYLAYYYIFDKEFKLDNAYLNKIECQEKGYSFVNLEAVKKSSLFIERNICHRTVAEYLAAKFLTDKEIPVDKIKPLLMDNNVVFSDYRGVYSWLCSFTSDQQLINIDPYLQYQYGDNSFFSLEQKKAVVTSIESYSENDPYFYRKGLPTAAKLFYEKDLDAFLVEKYDGILIKNARNHFLFFLSDLLALSTSPSVIQLADEVLNKEDLEYYYKKPFIDILKRGNKKQELLKALNRILKGELSDKEDELKTKILNVIYPELISSDDIFKYVALFKKDNRIYGCNFLENTPIEKQDEFLKKIFDIKYSEKMISCLYEDYAKNYFFRIIQTYSAEKFWNIIKELTEENQERISFLQELWYSNKLKIIEINNNKAEKLYEEYLNFIIPQIPKSIVATVAYNFIINKLNLNTDYMVSKIKEFISRTEEENIKLEILWWIFRLYRNDEKTKFNYLEKTLSVAQEFGLDTFFKTNYEKAIEPNKQLLEMQKKREQIQKERDKKIEDAINKNETWLSKLSVEQRRQSENLLINVSSRLLFERNLDINIEPAIGLRTKTINELIDVIKNIPFYRLDERIFSSETNLDALAIDPYRHLDILYYVALTLNNSEQFENIKDEALLEYLYIIALLNGAINIRKTDFAEWYETDEKRAVAAIHRFIELVLKECIKEESLHTAICSLVNSDSELKSLRKLVSDMRKENILDFFFDSFLAVYNIKIDEHLVEQIKLKATNDITKEKCDVLIAFFQKQKIEKDDIPILFHLLPGSYDQLSVNKIDEKDRLDVINYFLDVFNTEESIDSHSGMQSQIDNIASFFVDFVWKQFKGKEGQNFLNTLLTMHSKDIWTGRIKNRIKEIDEELNVPKSISTDDLRAFAIDNEIFSDNDFFESVKGYLNDLASTIKDHQDNDLDSFYDGEKPCVENKCRDEIVRRLKDRHSKEIDIFEREHNEGDNRVDINLKLLRNKIFEVQIECKKDNNASISSAIKDQLIDKYFKTKIQHGILLVFCFKEDPGKLKQELIKIKAIPLGYENKIEIICMDLRRT